MPPATGRGRAAAALSAALIGQLAFAALLLRADENGVSVAGVPLAAQCWFRQFTGLRCPACGMTRSVALTLDGHITAALRLNPAGPLWVVAVAAVAGALLWLAWRERTAAAARRVRNLALAHGAAFLLVMFGQWIVMLLARR